MNAWTILIAAGPGAYLLRSVLLLAFHGAQPPERLARASRFVGPAILVALRFAEPPDERGNGTSRYRTTVTDGRRSGCFATKHGARCAGWARLLPRATGSSGSDPLGPPVVG